MALSQYIFGAVWALILPLPMRKIFTAGPRITAILFCSLMIFAAQLLPLPPAASLTLLVGAAVICCRRGFSADMTSSLICGLLTSELMWLCIGLSSSLFTVIMGIFRDMGGVFFTGRLFVILLGLLPAAAYPFISGFIFDKLKTAPADKKHAAMLFAPLTVVYIAEIYIVRVLYAVADTETPVSVNADILLVQLLCGAAIFCTVSAYASSAESENMRRRITYFEAEKNLDKAYAAEVQAAVSLRHDIKNHLLMIGKLIDGQKYEKAESYIKSLEACCRSTAVSYRTGNDILDIILTEKLSDFPGKITVKCGVPEGVEETDICTIFANAADNAINASKALKDSEKRITLTTQKRGELLFIVMENTFDGKPFTEGTGLANIRRTAEKYGGSAEFTSKGNIFAMKAVLCISQQKESRSQQNS